MRALLIGPLFVTLIGCSCPIPRQAMLDGCTTSGCFERTAVVRPIELTPAPLKTNSVTTKVKPATKPNSTIAKAMPATKPNSTIAKAKPAIRPNSTTAKAKLTPATTTARPLSAELGKQVSLTEEKTKPPTATMPVVPVSQPSDTSDSILKKAKTTIAAKMENPASAEFNDMNRAIRKNTFGQPIDTICGRVKGKKTSGEDTGERPFLYLVKENEAYVVDGGPNSVAATAYRTICTSQDSRSNDAR